MNKMFLIKAKKITIIFTIWLFPLLLTGCWDRVEINDLALVLATGIDISEEGEIELSVQLAIPKAMGGGQGSSGGQGGDQPTTVEKVTGRTIFDCQSKLQASTSRRLFWGHNRVVIIGEKLAEIGIQKHVDFFARHPEPRLRAYVFVSKGKPTDILKIVPDFDDSSSEVAREIAKFEIGMSVTLKELIEMLSGDANTALPWIEVEKEVQGKGGVQVYGTAVFKKDKMIGRMDEELSRGLLWLRNEIKLAAVTIKPEDAEGQISFDLLRSRTELIPKIENDNWKMTIKVTTEDDAVENETKLNLMNPEVVKKLQKQMEAEIKERIRLALEQVQKEMKVDILGFAEIFHRQYPDQWSKVKDQWEEKFPEINIEIQAKAYIKRPGLSTSPQGISEEEVREK